MFFKYKYSTKIFSLKQFKDLFTINKSSKANFRFYDDGKSFFFILGSVNYFINKKTKLSKNLDINSLKKYLLNNSSWVRDGVEGIYIVIKYDKKKGITAFADKNNFRDLYYSNINNYLMLSDNISEIKKNLYLKDIKLNQIALAHMLNVYAVYSPKKLTVFTDKERKELKEIINEVLDEREKRHYKEDDSWLYRGMY